VQIAQKCSIKKLKMENGGGGGVVVAHEREDLKRGHINSATPIYKNATHDCKIKKVPCWLIELQKCHYGLKLLAQ